MRRLGTAYKAITRSTIHKYERQNPQPTSSISTAVHKSVLDIRKNDNQTYCSEQGREESSQSARHGIQTTRLKKNDHGSGK